MNVDEMELCHVMLVLILTDINIIRHINDVFGDCGPVCLRSESSPCVVLGLFIFLMIIFTTQGAPDRGRLMVILFLPLLSSCTKCRHLFTKLLANVLIM